MNVERTNLPTASTLNDTRGALAKPAVSGDFQSMLSQVSAKPADDKIAHTAKGFEALMIGQILKSAQSGDEGIFGSGSDQAGSIAIEMAQEQFAQAMAARGGLGIAKLVEKGLQHSRSSSSAVPQQ